MSRRVPWWAVAVPAALAALAFANALFNGLAWDDAALVLSNRALSSPAALLDAFSAPFWASMYAPEELIGVSSARYYRPLVHVALWLVHGVVGTRPWAFHALVVAMHVATSALVAWVAARSAPPDVEGPWAFFPAVAAGSWFAVHPVHTEAVAWISGLADVGATLLVTSVAALIHTERAISVRRAAALTALCIAAPLFKEPGFLASGVVAWGIAGRPAVERQRLLAVLALSLALVGLLRSNALQETVVGWSNAALGLDGWVRGGLLLLGQGVLWLAAPLELNAYHVLHVPESWAAPVVVSGLAAVVALGCGAWRWSEVRGPLAWLALSLVPGTVVPLLGPNAFAERYLYLPSVGAAWVLALALAQLPSHAGLRRVVAALVVAVVGCGAVTTWQRNPVWADDVTLFTDVGAKSPDCPIVDENISRALLSRNQPAEVVARLEGRQGLAPRTAINLSSAYARLRRYDDAARTLEGLLQTNERHGDAWLNLCLVHQATRQYERALTECARAVELRGWSAEYAAVFSRALLLAGNAEAAEHEARRGLALDATNAHAREILQRLEQKRAPPP